jgi:hypothetical protein
LGKDVLQDDCNPWLNVETKVEGNQVTIKLM